VTPCGLAQGAVCIKNKELKRIAKYKELLSIEKSIVIRINHTTDYNNYNELLNGEYKE